MLKRSPIKKISQKQLLKNKEKAEQTKRRFELFLEIWEERKEEDRLGYFCRCFETGKKLYEPYYMDSSTIYHHLLEKNKFPEYDLLKENIVLLHPDIHSQVHSDIDKTPKVKKATQELLNKLRND